MVGDETHLPTRPLSKEGLAGDLSHEAVAFRRKASVEDVTWRLGETVVSADLAARTVQLSDGSQLCGGLVATRGVGVGAARYQRVAPSSMPSTTRQVTGQPPFQLLSGRRQR